MRKGEVACNKQFLPFPQCFLPYMVLIFHFKCTLKCCLQFVSIWTSPKFCRLIKVKCSFCTNLPYFVNWWVTAGRIHSSFTPDHCFEWLLCGKAASGLEKNLCFSLVLSIVNHFPNKPWFSRVCSTSLLKTLCGKEKLLMTNNFSFSHSVFNPFREHSAISIKF